MASDSTSEWRYDYLTDRRVLIASNRGDRPGAYSQRMGFEPIARCPFCAGHEADSPIEIATHRLAGSGNPWDVRVVSNLYPAVALTTPKAFGKHEVIIESPKHIGQFGQLSKEQIELVLRSWQERLIAVRSIPEIQHAMIFKNNGPTAGASLEHCHSQLLALGIVPSSVISELQRCTAFSKKGISYFEDWKERERQFKKRVVRDRGGFLAICPIASRKPYEVCILPEISEPRFTDVEPEHLSILAGILKDLLETLTHLDNPDFNILLHQAPYEESSLPPDIESIYSWRMEIVPRMTFDAGFEWGTGYSINPMPPERAAEQLRGRL